MNNECKIVNLIKITKNTCLIQKSVLYFKSNLNEVVYKISRSGEMADALDSKSSWGNSVRVQVPPSAPIKVP